MDSKHFTLIILILSVLSKSNVATSDTHASKGHAPTHAPAPAPTHHAPTHSPTDEGAQEQKFLDAMKTYWKKTFGDMHMPPPINNSITHPPTKNVVQALDAIAKRESDNDSKKGNKVDVKSDAAREKEFEASTSSGKIDPKLEEDMAKKLAGMFSGPKGPNPKDVADMKKLIQSLVSAHHSKASSSSSASKEEEELKSAIHKAMNSKDTDKKLDHGEFAEAVKAMGYGGEHAMSTILAVTKCYGPPDVNHKLHEKSVESLFFPGQDLSPGNKLKLRFRKSTNNGAFMSCIKEDRSGVLSAVVLMDLVGIMEKAMDKKKDPNLTAELDTIIMCDQPATKGKNKDKACAMDLESMVNYTMGKIGKDIRPAATWLTKESSAPVEYTISTIKQLPAINTVGCCKMGFPFAVFYCETLPKSVNYILSLVGEDGSSLKAPVICHEDTTEWNPNSWIFSTLKTKPGGSKICHFLGADDVAWTPKS